MRNVAVGIGIVAALLIAGCTNPANPVSGQAQVPVNLSVAFSSSGSGLSLMKMASGLTADSIRIDSAIVIFARIKFESRIDSVAVDSTGEDSTEVEDDSGLNVTFRGPFVVHVRDTVAIDFANQMLPAGTYDGIKFKIHRLQPGENHEDSDEHEGRVVSPFADTSGYGASIVVWGQVYKNGAWQPFEFKFNSEFEFKIRGNFVITEATSTVNIALNFNLGLWFRNPNDGSLLDPTDVTITNQELFRRAIRQSFWWGTGGHDDNHDGHPDDHD